MTKIEPQDFGEEMDINIQNTFDSKISKIETHVFVEEMDIYAKDNSNIEMIKLEPQDYSKEMDIYVKDGLDVKEKLPNAESIISQESPNFTSDNVQLGQSVPELHKLLFVKNMRLKRRCTTSDLRKFRHEKPVVECFYPLERSDDSHNRLSFDPNLLLEEPKPGHPTMNANVGEAMKIEIVPDALIGEEINEEENQLNERELLKSTDNSINANVGEAMKIEIVPDVLIDEGINEENNQLNERELLKSTDNSINANVGEAMKIEIVPDMHIDEEIIEEENQLSEHELSKSTYNSINTNVGEAIKIEIVPDMHIDEEIYERENQLNENELSKSTDNSIKMTNNRKQCYRSKRGNSYKNNRKKRKINIIEAIQSVMAEPNPPRDLELAENNEILPVSPTPSNSTKPKGTRKKCTICRKTMQNVARHLAKIHGCQTSEKEHYLSQIRLRKHGQEKGFLCPHTDCVGHPPYPRLDRHLQRVHKMDKKSSQCTIIFLKEQSKLKANPAADVISSDYSAYLQTVYGGNLSKDSAIRCKYKLQLLLDGIKLTDVKESWSNDTLNNLKNWCIEYANKNSASSVLTYLCVYINYLKYVRSLFPLENSINEFQAKLNN